MTSQAPPSVPPRPTRTESPQPPSQAIPAIPPRPVRPAAVQQAKSSENGLPSPSPSPEPKEPPPKTIGSSTELHAPVALPSRPAPVPKTESEQNAISSATPLSVAKTPSETEGIPQIGRRVPMHPNSGDVQAPTPSATPSGGKKKHVYREEWEMDEGAYGSKRKETPYSMSSTDLNAVVAHSTSPGIGEDECEQGVPDEELAFIATDNYARELSRSQSPVHTRNHVRNSFHDGERTDDQGNVIHVEDPLHEPGYLRRGNSEHASRAQSHHEDEEEEFDQYSILAEDEVLKRKESQYMQAAVYTPSYTPRHPRSRPPSSLGHRGDIEGATLELNTRYKSGLESRDSMRTPYEELSPADENAEPLFPESDDEKEDTPENPLIERLKRPGLAEQRFPSRDVWEEAPEHAQLEATVESPPPGEKEPVEDYDKEEMARRKNAEPKHQYIRGQPHEHYEPGDEQEYERKEKEAAMKADDYRLDLKDLPEDERLQRLHKSTNNDDNASESSSANRRTTHRRKFPSNDIWEDVPPSLDLQEEIEPTPIPERATTGDISVISSAPSARPTTGAPIEGGSVSAKPAVPARPSVPARPHREKKFPPATIHEQPEPPATLPSSEKKAPPSVPDRPKPSIPARPIGKLAGFVRAQPDEAPEPKPKPPVPPRTGGKIAALKAGLGDLESRLRLGPIAPKKEEKKEDEQPVKEEPLTDVRKSRARGPRGRKLPTKEEPPKPTDVGEPLESASQLIGAWTVFTLDEELDAVVVGTASAATEEKSAPPVAEADAPVVRKDDEATEESELTTVLPGVTGTGDQALVATTQLKEVEPEDADKKPSTAEEGNPTLIPSGEHPEDAVEPSMTEVNKADNISETAQMKELEQPEIVGEQGAAEREA